MIANTSRESNPLCTFEWSRPETPADAVVRTVAAVTGRDATELRQLYAVVDPDALDDLFEQRPGSTTLSNGRVAFAYADHWIVLTSGGRGYVFEAKPSRE